MSISGKRGTRDMSMDERWVREKMRGKRRAGGAQDEDTLVSTRLEDGLVGLLEVMGPRRERRATKDS
jgi:hypothetical protein